MTSTSGHSGTNSQRKSEVVEESAQRSKLHQILHTTLQMCLRALRIEVKGCYRYHRVFMTLVALGPLGRSFWCSVHFIPSLHDLWPFSVKACLGQATGGRSPQVPAFPQFSRTCRGGGHSQGVAKPQLQTDPAVPLLGAVRNVRPQGHRDLPRARKKNGFTTPPCPFVEQPACLAYDISIL